MTETEWVTCDDPMPMLDFLGTRASVRKLRLLACACCRRLWPHLSDKAKRSVEVAELFADGEVSRQALREARGPCYSGLRADNSASYAAEDSQKFRRHVRVSLLHAGWSAGWPEWVERVIPENEAAEKAAQAVLLREVFANPFRHTTRKRAWLTSTVVALARGMYESRDSGAMPILADAVQDAGCDSDDILDHCRGPGPHVRGCWVVDLVLGKA